MATDFLFSEEPVEALNEPVRQPWKVLIVDDEPEVHAVTKLALSDFEFQGRNLTFHSAYSGSEAKALVQEHPDAAIVLLDVVMESDDAGLQVTRFIREEENNHHIRIILRTGQPGQAPERDVILNYDINDYKNKTELTAQKLFTVVISSLRSYRDILSIEKSRIGLEKIILSSRDMFSAHSMEQFIQGVMEQFTSILGNVDEAMYATSLVATVDDDKPKDMLVVAGQGDFANNTGKAVTDILNDEQLKACQEALAKHDIVFRDNYFFASCSSAHDHTSLIYVSGMPTELTEANKRLIQLFTENVQIAYENVKLHEECDSLGLHK